MPITDPPTNMGGKVSSKFFKSENENSDQLYSALQKLITSHIQFQADEKRSFQFDSLQNKSVPY